MALIQGTARVEGFEYSVMSQVLKCLFLSFIHRSTHLSIKIQFPELRVKLCSQALTSIYSKMLGNHIEVLECNLFIQYHLLGSLTLPLLRKHYPSQHDLSKLVDTGSI